ncbi:MAG TPA: cobalamin biosynthesis protein CbiM, partial [Methanofollis liminatans]|nr:cobalamin biosynthesis protein CbiM [Methanofollis liminatans]
HAAIGVIEAVITAGAVYLIASARPDLMKTSTGAAA